MFDGELSEDAMPSRAFPGHDLFALAEDDGAPGFVVRRRERDGAKLAAFEILLNSGKGSVRGSEHIVEETSKRLRIHQTVRFWHIASAAEQPELSDPAKTAGKQRKRVDAKDLLDGEGFPGSRQSFDAIREAPGMVGELDGIDGAGRSPGYDLDREIGIVASQMPQEADLVGPPRAAAG